METHGSEYRAGKSHRFGIDFGSDHIFLSRKYFTLEFTCSGGYMYEVGYYHVLSSVYGHIGIFDLENVL
jgi:hypothetical protein